MLKSEQKPSALQKELLDREAFVRLLDYNPSEPGEPEGEAPKCHNERWSPPSLLTKNAGSRNLLVALSRS